MSWYTNALIIFMWLWAALYFIALRRLTKSQNRANALQQELDALTTRLYGSPEIYERSKEHQRECRTDREEKVAREAALKGITRADKQYPSRFRSTRG